MTEDDRIFLRKILSDLAVFPVIPIPPGEMARCFRLMIIETLDLEMSNKRDRAKRSKAGAVLDENVE